MKEVIRVELEDGVLDDAFDKRMERLLIHLATLPLTFIRSGIVEVNMPKHTPGPWEFEQSTVGSDIYLIRPAGPTRTKTIAQVRHMSHIRRRAETEANARLITAAPKLHDALRAVAPLLPDDAQVQVYKLLASIEEEI